MSTISITWVYEPEESPMFHLGRDRAFVDEVGRRAGTTIELIEGRLCDLTPPAGFILLNSFHPRRALEQCSVDARSALAARVIALDVSPSRIFERVLDGLAGAVDSISHLEWSRNPNPGAGASGVYGHREVGQRIGATCDGEGSERYCRFRSTTHEGLPHLLADYLLVLDDTRSRSG